MEDSKNIVQNFFIALQAEKHNPSTLLLKVSNFDTVQLDNPHTETIVGEDWKSKKRDSYELVIGDYPIGKSKVKLDQGLNVPHNWKNLFDSLEFLEETGTGFYFVESGFTSSHVGSKFLSYLQKNGYSFNSVLNPPKKLYWPQTGFQPILVEISKRKTKGLFIGEIDEYSIDLLARNLVNRNDTGTLEGGQIVTQGSFESFHNFRLSEQIERLQTQYKEYTNYRLSEIASEINLARAGNEFEECPNSIYIPKIGNSAVTSNLSDVKIKHHNLFQVVLKTTLVKSEFLSLFFRSDLGKLTLESLYTGSFIRMINKGAIKECMVALPPIPKQELLIQTDKKLNQLQGVIDELRDELSLNPNNADLILDRFDAISKPFIALSQEDEILNLIRRGEGKSIEFKQTFEKDIKNNQKNKALIKSALKNVAGFLNADGGVLLIGVADNGQITGIEEDIYQNDDKYLLKFKDHIKSKIGLQFLPFINYDIFNVQGKKVLKVNCERSNEPCFYEEKEFYLRTNPATDLLEGSKLYHYLKKRFPKE
jgi:hypothetical protein